MNSFNADLISQPAMNATAMKAAVSKLVKVMAGCADQGDAKYFHRVGRRRCSGIGRRISDRSEGICLKHRPKNRAKARMVPLQQFEVQCDLVAGNDAGFAANGHLHGQEITALLHREERGAPRLAIKRHLYLH